MIEDPSGICRIRANGIEFAYLEAGSGPLVLCLHGFPDTAWSFAPMLQRLAAAGYRAVAPFMRGYAPSGLAADGDYRATTLARDAAALVQALGESRAFLVGHDWGAVAAYLAAAQAPERWRGVVTAAIPHLRRFLFWPTARQLARSRYMAFFQLRGIPERRIVADDFAWLRALIRTWSPGWDFSEQDFAPLKEGFSDPQRLRAALAYYRALPAVLAEHASWPLLFTPLQVPVRVICGGQDGCIGREMFERQAQHFAAGYDLIELPDAGHFMQCEQPEAFSRAVIEFIARH